MRRFILPLVFAALLPFTLSAQTEQPLAAANAAAEAASTPHSEWLGSFSGISIHGRMQVTLIKNATESAPRITYDTFGELSPKFKISIDRNGILKVEEPVDSKRTTVTQVTLWCNDIESLNVTAADVAIETAIAREMFDLEVSGGANVRGRFEVMDLAVTATGRSNIVVGGEAKYMHLNISTAKFDGQELSTVSSLVEASHSSEVMLSVSEHLEGTTSTSAKILYRGTPRIVRSRITMFGGEISAIE